jgi:predicted RNA-binding Zn ribbon-like protein
MQKTIETIPLDGGRLCFDLVNTVHSWKTEDPTDFFLEYDDFLVWCRRLSLRVPSKRTLSKYHDKRDFATALAKIIQVREVLYHMFSSIANGSVPGEAVTAAFNKYLAEALEKIRIQFSPGKASVVIDDEKDALLGPLFHILKSCYDVLTLDDIGRIKQCSTCGWIFYDSTRNNRRRWCNPLTCGSMDKSKRYYWRTKGR